MYRLQLRTSALAVFATAMAIPGMAATIDVTVRAGTLMDVNGQTTVPDGLFGVTAYNGATAACNPDARDFLRSCGVRWVGLPGHAGWAFPTKPPACFPDDFSGWAETPEARARLFRYFGGYDIPSGLRDWRVVGITPMLYLLDCPWVPRHEKLKEVPLDAHLTGLVLAEYVAFCRQADPRLNWLHLGNEPNAKWFRVDKDGMDYAKLFQVVARAVHARNPGVRIGGPVLCWPPAWPPAQKGLPSWYTWDMWAQPLLDIAGDELDFFDYHLYSTSTPLIGVEEVQLLVNAMFNQSGRRKPVLITEYGHYLKPGDTASPVRLWRKRIAPWQEQVMAFLDYQPDKVVSLQVHDYAAQAGGQFRIFKGTDPDDQMGLARMFQAWKPFTGRRLLTRSGDSAVRPFASLDGESLTTMLVNTTDRPQTVRLNITELADAPENACGAAVHRFVRLVTSGTLQDGQADNQSEGMQDTRTGGVVGGGAEPADLVEDAEEGAPEDDPAARIEYGVLKAETPFFTFGLAPHETRAVTVQLKGPSEPKRRLVTADYFGDRLHADFEEPGDELTFTIKLPEGVPAGAMNPRLRVGMLGPRSGDSLRMTVAGRVKEIGSDWFQEVPLDALPTGQSLSATFTLLNRDSPEERPKLLRISSVCLALDHEDAVREPVPPTDTVAETTWELAQPTQGGGSLPGGALCLHAVQDRQDPSLTAGYSQEAPFEGNSLGARAISGPGAGPASAMLFMPRREGWYRCAIKGRLTARTAATAGYALLTVYRVDRFRQVATKLASIRLNTPGGFGKYPDTLEFRDTVPLTADEEFALRLQVVSPGPAPAGTARVTFDTLTIERVVARE